MDHAGAPNGTVGATDGLSGGGLPVPAAAAVAAASTCAFLLAVFGGALLWHWRRRKPKWSVKMRAEMRKMRRCERRSIAQADGESSSSKPVSSSNPVVTSSPDHVRTSSYPSSAAFQPARLLWVHPK